MHEKQRGDPNVLSTGLFGISFTPRHRHEDDEAPWQADERCAKEEAARRKEANSPETAKARKGRRYVSAPLIWVAKGAAATFAATCVAWIVLLKH